jgi:hypothetical protein
MPLDAARDAVIATQATVIQALATENLRLAGQVADLAARVERLERLASRNSGNSSMPPSADVPGSSARHSASRCERVEGLGEPFQEPT